MLPSPRKLRRPAPMRATSSISAPGNAG